MLPAKANKIPVTMSVIRYLLKGFLPLQVNLYEMNANEIF